jgi:6-phosphogluconolactonase (cycloisomerase 2 family)
VDQSGNVWVANYGSANVTKLSSAGATLGTYSVGSSHVGVAVDQSGNVWVANYGSNNVTKMSSGSNGVLVPLVQNFSQNTSILLGVAATSVTVSNYSVPVNINGTTYYMRLSSTP